MKAMKLREKKLNSQASPAAAAAAAADPPTIEAPPPQPSEPSPPGHAEEISSPSAEPTTERVFKSDANLSDRLSIKQV